jgi:ADP-ribose 1''-phosphate phosphatase
VAAAFLERYPGAHQVYVSTCNSLRGGEALVGTALLIPPQEGDVDAVRRHWVACLFTSVAYGKKADPPEKILRYTKDAVEDLWRQVEALEKEGGHAPGQWHSAKINSARFKVPWQDTANVIEDVLAGKGRQVVVYEYDERAARQGGGGRGGRGGGRGGRGRGRGR